MTRILSPKEFEKWFKKFYTKKGLERICQAPTVSDRNDYQIVHLDGLSFSRAWNMKNIARHLPKNHTVGNTFRTASQEFIQKSLPVLFDSGYGGEHWLASFAIFALSTK